MTRQSRGAVKFGGASWVGVCLVALAGTGCAEEVSAPGACPEFCPSVSLSAVDTVIANAIVLDSSFRGSVAAHEAQQLQVATPVGSGDSRVIVQFNSFPTRVFLIPPDSTISDTTSIEVVAVDSFRVELVIERRAAVGGLELLVQRMPLGFDTLTTHADVSPFFDASTLIATIALPDTLRSGRVAAVMPRSAFPTFDTDNRNTAIGVALRAPAPAYVVLEGRFSVEGPALARFVQADSSGMSVERFDARLARFATFLSPGLPPVAVGDNVVGGSPSARVLLRTALPSSIVDSSQVLRARLLLVPTEPAIGAPSDTARVMAYAVAADFGPKSPTCTVNLCGPFVVQPSDSLTRAGFVRVGNSDTVAVDVTHIIAGWRGDSLLPRSIMLISANEGAALTELRFGSAGTPGATPVLNVTFTPTLVGASR